MLPANLRRRHSCFLLLQDRDDPSATRLNRWRAVASASVNLLFLISSVLPSRPDSTFRWLRFRGSRQLHSTDRQIK
jgi:hypothetical protein